MYFGSLLVWSIRCQDISNDLKEVIQYSTGDEGHSQLDFQDSWQSSQEWTSQQKIKKINKKATPQTLQPAKCWGSCQCNWLNKSGLFWAESKMNMFGHNAQCHIWKPNISCQHSGGELMLRACVAGTGPGHLAIIEWHIKQSVYSRILEYTDCLMWGHLSSI